MTRSSRWWVGLSAAWLAFVWTTRIRNAVGDTTLSGSGAVVAYTLSIAGLLGAVALVGVLLGRVSMKVAVAVSLGHVLVWAVRIPMILLATHPVGFKVVHAGLGLVSGVLAFGLWRATPRPLASTTHGAASHGY